MLMMMYAQGAVFKLPQLAFAQHVLSSIITTKQSSGKYSILYIRRYAEKKGAISFSLLALQFVEK